MGFVRPREFNDLNNQGGALKHVVPPFTRVGS